MEAYSWPNVPLIILCLVSVEIEEISYAQDRYKTKLINNIINNTRINNMNNIINNTSNSLSLNLNNNILGNVVRVNNSQQLSDFILDFVEQSSQVRINNQQQQQQRQHLKHVDEMINNRLNPATAAINATPDDVENNNGELKPRESVEPQPQKPKENGAEKTHPQHSQNKAFKEDMENLNEDDEEMAKLEKIRERLSAFIQNQGGSKSSNFALRCYKTQ